MSKKRVCVHQPNYLPWPGFFWKLMCSDIYIVLDTVQFIRRGYQNRTKINVNNKEIWLTIPVIKKGYYNQLIKDTKIDIYTPWFCKHVKTLQQNYPGMERLILETTMDYHLCDFNVDVIKNIVDMLGMDIKIYKASEILFGDYSEPTMRLVELIKRVGGTTYISGKSGKKYMDMTKFKFSNIDVEYSLYNTPSPSIIDMIYKIGADETIKKIRGSGICTKEF